VRVTEWEPPEFRRSTSPSTEPGSDDLVGPSDPPSSAASSSGLSSCPPPAGGSSSWLVDEPQVERIALDERCWVDVVRGLLPRADQVHAELAADVNWQQGRVFRYERWIDEPRLGAWQVGAGRHPALAEAQDWLSRRYRVRFDGVALAHYRDGRDSVAWHRDRELKWLDDTVIGVLSLGARRPWLMRPLTGARVEAADVTDAIDLAPAGGDLLVMGGASQNRWLHAVPKTRGPSWSRISAQWRWTSRRGQPDRNPSYYAPRHYSR
jgi:alkylated DNA repair dioxygenase AlkB